MKKPIFNVLKGLGIAFLVIIVLIAFTGSVKGETAPQNAPETSVPSQSVPVSTKAVNVAPGTALPTPMQALNVLYTASAEYVGTREDHQKIQLSAEVLRTFILEHTEKPKDDGAKQEKPDSEPKNEDS